MAKRKHSAKSPAAATANGGAQPSESEQAAGVVTSSADPRPTSDHGRRLDSHEALLKQIAIKIGL